MINLVCWFVQVDIKYNKIDHIDNTQDTTTLRLFTTLSVLCNLSPTPNQQGSWWYPHMPTVHPDWWNHSHQMLLGRPVSQKNELDCLNFHTRKHNNNFYSVANPGAHVTSCIIHHNAIIQSENVASIQYVYMIINHISHILVTLIPF